MSFLRRKSQPPGVYYLTNRREWTNAGVEWKEGELIKNIIDEVCQCIRLVPVVRPFFALCDGKTGHALLSSSRITAAQAKRAYHLRVFVNAGENSQNLSKYCTAAKNYYFLQLQTDFTEGRFISQITLVTAFRLSAIDMVRVTLETGKSYRDLRTRLGDFMPSYLKDKVKGREGEDTLQKHYTKYKERFNDKTPDILKGQYLMMYEHDDSCGQHVFQVNQIHVLDTSNTRDVSKVTLTLSAKEVKSSHESEGFNLADCKIFHVDLATATAKFTIGSSELEKTYVFSSGDVLLSFAAVLDSYWKLKVDINSSPLLDDLLPQEHMSAAIGRDRRELLHGPISDESTKLVFSQHHMKDGLFLLRESRSRDATYILSLCHEGDVKHYKIRRDISRGFCLEDQNEQTPSSSEKGFHQTLHVLISNHNHVKDGLPVILKENCNPSVTGPIPLFPYQRVIEELSPIIQRFQAEGVSYIRFEQLTITRELGSGHFSNVHEAEWRVDGQEEVKVAIKIPTMKADQAAAVIKEMEKEVLTMFRLEHPNIVKLLGVTDAKHFLTQIGHFPMIVMEFIKGGSLSSMLERQRRTMALSNSRALSVPVMQQAEIMYLTFCQQIAAAMDYLVEKSVVHRDLATRNVLVISDTHVKVSDFGLARQCIDDKDYYRPSSDAQDLPVYWYAPECLESLIFSHTSDVWSFGVTMWEIFTIGRKPLEFLKPIHKRPNQSLKDACAPLVHHYKIIGPSKLPKLPTCPDNVYNVIKKCWTVDPKSRSTFTELNQLLKQLLTDLTSTEV